MLDGRVLEASQVEYKPFGKPPLQRYRESPEEHEVLRRWCEAFGCGLTGTCELDHVVPVRQAFAGSVPTLATATAEDAEGERVVHELGEPRGSRRHGSGAPSCPL